jgi:hypothetical protein
MSAEPANATAPKYKSRLRSLRVRRRASIRSSVIRTPHRAGGSASSVMRLVP